MRLAVASALALALGLAGCAAQNEAADGGMDAIAQCAVVRPETDAVACANGCDDDGDGSVDCEDLDCCAAVACGPTTTCGRDAGAHCDASCVETGAATCTNGLDDDCDGFIDCDDYSCCSSVSCGSDTQCGRRPDAGPRPPAPACDGAVTPETTLDACSDGCDDDANGFVDCDDRNCCTARTDCPTTSYCGRLPACAPPCVSGPESTLAACSDGCSNDGDTFIDCEDRDCCAVRSDCAPATYCGRTAVDAGPCASGPENTLTACSDGCSNDGDTFIDCEDRDCCAVRTDCAPATYCGHT